MKVTDEMLRTAMVKAVETKLLQKHVGEELYLHNWSSMRTVLQSVLDELFEGRYCEIPRTLEAIACHGLDAGQCRDRAIKAMTMLKE